MSISVLIQTHNEEKHIEACIHSAKLLTDNIVVVDMESTDKTIELAKKLDIETYMFPYSHCVEPAREFGIRKANTSWVMILDADERITKELAKEIKIVVNREFTLSEAEGSKVDSKKEEITHYKIPRKNMFGGTKWLKHGGWWPDYQIRLINTEAFITWPNNIHSTPQIKGNIGYLTSPFIHQFHGNLTSMVQKTIVFENIEAELLFRAKKSVSTFTFFRKFLGELWRRLLKEKGFLDGEIGIIESIYQAFSKTITYLFLYEKNRRTV